MTTDIIKRDFALYVRKRGTNKVLQAYSLLRDVAEVGQVDTLRELQELLQEIINDREDDDT